MMDAVEAGGLGLSDIELGNINGTFGTAGFLAGSLLGSLFVARKGLRRTLLILCVCINVPNATYILLSMLQPESLTLITAVVTFEKLGFGFGAVGHMIYMMQQLAPGPYRTAHYAFGTGIMGLCMWSTGRVSGVIQEAMGYESFFVFVMVATIPSFVVTYLAPFPHGSDQTEG